MPTSTEHAEIPVITKSLEMLLYLLDRDDELSADELRTVAALVGRNPAVTLLYDLHCEDMLSPDAYRVVAGIWSESEYPQELLSNDEWRELFHKAGYCAGGESVKRPTEPLVLYRGSVPSRRRRWSWTSSLEIARQFAHGISWRPTDGVVWTARVAPWRLFAHINEADGRAESEYVVDTRRLRITQWKDD